MRIDLIATEPHYLEHLAPVWKALTIEERGAVEIPERLRGLAIALGIGQGAARLESRTLSTALVASWRDAQGAKLGRKRVALMEHGVGQSYCGRHPAYAGGENRFDVALLCPNERVKSLGLRANPKSPAWVVGSPYLDELRKIERKAGAKEVFVSFHYDASDIEPELACTRDYWWNAVVKLADRFDVVGHAHPRDLDRAALRFGSISAPFVSNFKSVVSQAGVYVCDNSSTIYFAAALGIPVVLLNHPGYRRNVEHGLRFWEMADVGWQVDGEPDCLSIAVGLAQSGPPLPERTTEICAELFPYDDGRCAQRAAEALRELQ